MATTEKILCRIEKGCTLDELANEFGMRKSVLFTRIEFLARAGYLSEIRSGNGYGSSANCKSCCVFGRADAGMKMYILTEKGIFNTSKTRNVRF